MKFHLRLLFLLLFLLPVISNAAPAGAGYDAATEMVLQKCSELSPIDTPPDTGFEHSRLTIARKKSITPKGRRRLIALDNENEDEESSIQARKNKFPKPVVSGFEGYFSAVFCPPARRQCYRSSTCVQRSCGNHPPQYFSRRRHIILQVFRI